MFRTAVTALLLPTLLVAPSLALADEAAPAAVADAAAPAGASAAAPEPATPAVAQASPEAGAASAPEAALPTAAAPAPVEPDVSAEVTPPPPLQVNLFASSSYSFNFNRPVSQVNGLRVFDTEDGSARLDVVELVLQHAPGGPGEAGFRLDLTAGSAVPHVAASAGLFRDDMGVAQDFDVQQAYASYVAKIGGGLRLDAGKFITHMGLEVIEGYDGMNDNYSRSILFGYAIPFTHTGLRVSLPVGSKAAGTLMLVNGWDNVKDNNERPSLGAQLALTPSPKASLWVNYIGGPEQSGENSALRHVANVVGAFKVTDTLTVSLDGVFGTEADVVDTDGDMAGDAAASWYGAAAYAKLQATDALALTLRGEWFSDADGARTGADQDLVEVTFTPTWQVASSFIVRGDLRLDRSSENVFATDDMADPSSTQFTTAINVIAIY